MKFVFLNGSLAGKKVETDQSVVSIGCDETNLLVIPDQGISARHCYAVNLDGQWILFDLESTNGVEVNGVKIAKKSPIADFDTIKLGGIEFVVLISDDAKSPINEKKVLTFGKKNSKSAKNLHKRRVKRQTRDRSKRVRKLVAISGLVLVGCIFGPEQYEKINKKLSLKPDINKDLIQLAKVSGAPAEEVVQLIEVSEAPGEDEKIEVIEQESAKEVLESQAVLVEVVDASEVKNELVANEVTKLDLNSVSIHSFTEKYCFECHNAKRQKGKIRLDDADFTFSTHASIYHWQDFLDVLNTGEMPPEDETQPSDKEMAKVIGLITDKLQSSRKKLAATGGTITMRHLNRREYSGSIKNLFNAEVQTTALPLDQYEGLDTHGKNQFFTSNHYCMYFDLGEKIAKSAIKGIQLKGKNNQIVRKDPEPRKNGQSKNFFERNSKGQLKLEDFKGMTEAEIRKIVQPNFEGKIGRINLPRDIRYLNDNNHKIAASGSVITHFGASPGYNYKVRVHSFGTVDAYSELLFMDNLRDKNVERVKFTKDRKKHVTEFTFNANLLQGKITFTTHTAIGAYIDYLEMIPLKSEISLFEECFGEVINSDISTSKIKSSLRKFSEQAFRNSSPKAEFIDSLANIYNDGIKNGKSRSDALAVCIATVLSSPSFLYIKEHNMNQSQKLANQEFISRMSFFLTGAPTSDKFLTMASRQNLNSKRGLAKAIDHLLYSERSEIGLSDFFEQWMELSRFDQIDFQTSGISKPLQEAARTEPLKFFNYLVKNNLPVDNLIDSDFTIANQYLADYYGIQGTFKGYQSVKLPLDSKRGGILTQAAFLMMGTAGQRTSPTIRGTVIRTKFLNDAPPPPPPNVPQLETQENGTQTVRELVNLHKQVVQCSSCHEKIDPIGYGLENFDHYGKYRTEEGIKIKKIRWNYVPQEFVPVEIEGHIDGRHSFTNLEGFKKALMSEKDKLARSVYESLLSYGIGREIEFIDEAEIHHSLVRLKKNNYRLKEMILEIVSTKIFRAQ
ncbi:MAG: DUF1588 domain-containing protein [Lentisphaeraceae bacterium]|nr:DUF1588 domain-containing protein [Lentisphaeraceae bacterium]